MQSQKVKHLVLWLAIWTFLPSFPVQASRCNDSQLLSGNLISDICWGCIFPITIMGARIGSGNNSQPANPGIAALGMTPNAPPEGAEVLDDAEQTNYDFNLTSYDRSTIPRGASNDRLCNCPDDLGLPQFGMMVSMWEPARVIEMVRNPGCAPALNGLEFPMSRKRLLGGGRDAGEQTGTEQSFYNYHYYAFPLLMMLGLFANVNCNADGYIDFDMLYISEFDPTWNSAMLAFLTAPESAIIALPPSIPACMIDAAVTANGGNPIDKLYWCAGSWGTLYPFAGTTTAKSTTIDKQLGALRSVAALHRRGLARQTMGDAAACHAPINLMMPRSQYKWTTFFPKPEAHRAHLSGESDWTWGLGRGDRPFTGEDTVFVKFRWRDCCVY